MDLKEQLKTILTSPHLESKISFFSSDNLDTDFVQSLEFDVKNYPFLASRDEKIRPKKKKSKFPKGHYHLRENLARALHSFANHELEAIEMMAYAIIHLPSSFLHDIKVRKHLLSALKDEQKHFLLYEKRMNQLGFSFGDFAVNDFFSKQMSGLKSLEEFMALMSLTFEQANLDFASYYAKIFQELDDMKSAEIMNQVLRDEIKHVKIGVLALESKLSADQDLFEYYESLLHFPITPSRARGKIYDRDSRIKAGLNEMYLTKLESYDDHFQVTKRKQWKS